MYSPSSPKFVSRLKSSGSKPLPFSRDRIECMDAGLRSVIGAKKIIEMIKSRRQTSKLILGHNALSDDGCVLLFAFLNSPLGRKYPITEISLNANSIGDRGLAAISAYLVDNTHLIELFLQNNLFTADPDTISLFADAINQSRLRFLSLTTNHSLSDGFTHIFFPALSSPCLQELHLSATGLTHHSTSSIVDFITSPERCRLHTLKCNGNALAFRGVRAIVRAIERANFSLTTVELYANNMSSGQDSDDTEDETNPPFDLNAWKDTEKLLKQVLARNSHLKKETGREALQLLVASRAALLRPKQPFAFGSSDTSLSSPTGFPFRELPTEIQLYILSFLTPVLSPAQRVRIFSYASSSLTLPTLPIRSSTSTEPSIFSLCAPDPSINMGMLPSPCVGGTVWPVSNSGGCAVGKCLGVSKSLLCHLEQQRSTWLEKVGCLAYDL